MPDALQSGSQVKSPPSAQPAQIVNGEAPVPSGRRVSLFARLAGLFVWWWKGSNRLDVANLNDRTLRDLGLDRPALDEDRTTAFWRLR